MIWKFLIQCIDIWMLCVNGDNKNINKEMEPKDNKIELLQEDIECVHKYLDDEDVERTLNGKTLSLVGRIKRLIDYVSIDKASNDELLDEIEHRDLIDRCVSMARTWQLEDELSYRWDATMIKLENASREELMEALGIEEGDIVDKESSCKDVICKALGFTNSFAYSVDDIINEIKNKLN